MKITPDEAFRNFDMFGEVEECGPWRRRGRTLARDMVVDGELWELVVHTDRHGWVESIWARPYYGNHPD